MTDTRKDFDTEIADILKSFHRRSCYPEATEYEISAAVIRIKQEIALLSDKRIQQLLAVIEAKNEALIKMRFIETIFNDDSGYVDAFEQADHVKLEEALALQPNDVELADIGYISEDGEEVFLTMGLPLDAETCGVPVAKLYTIKTKEPT